MSKLVDYYNRIKSAKSKEKGLEILALAISDSHILKELHKEANETINKNVIYSCTKVKA
jgi:hypothetical protein